MKRLSTSATILLSALLINTPAFAAENEPVSQSESEIATQTALVPEEENAPVSVASESLELSDEEAGETVENASDTPKVEKPKKEEPKKDDSWAEKISGKQLNTLKAKLEALQELYNVNWRSFRIAEAINRVEKAESPQKRNASLLDDLTRQQIFTAYAATYVFPELLEIHLQNISEHLKKKAESLVDEIVETEDEIKEIMNSYNDDVKLYREVNGAYIALVDRSQSVLDSMIKTNTDMANLTAFGYYLKNTNDELLKLVSSQLDSLREVTEQSTFALDYCRLQAEFITNSNESVSVKGKYLAEIRSSFKDLEIFLEKYKSRQEFNFHLFSKKVNDRFNELIEKVGKDEIRVGRIRKLVKETDFKPVNKSIKVFDTQPDLEDIFEKFGFTEVDAELFKTLLTYVGEESWHCRYVEPVSEEEMAKQKAEEEKANSSEKPKLIDLEDEPSELASDTAEVETVNASDSVEVGSEAELADSPDQITEQQQEEGNGGVAADGSGTSSDTAKIDQ